MARIRAIKPGFFTDDELAELPAIARLLFIGLWCVADREGRMEDRPAKIKAEILPYEKGSVDKLLGALASKGFIIRYEVGGRRFIQVTNFTKHQFPNKKECASTIPAPDGHLTITIPAPDEILPHAPKGNGNMVNGNGNMVEEEQEQNNLLLPQLNIFKLYEQHIGATFGPAVAQEMTEAEGEYTPECIKHCFEEADTHNKRSWAYVKAILKRHKETGSCYDWQGERPSEGGSEADWTERRYLIGKLFPGQSTEVAEDLTTPELNRRWEAQREAAFGQAAGGLLT